MLVGRRCGGRCWHAGVGGAVVGDSHLGCWEIGLAAVGDSRLGCWERAGLAVVGSTAGREGGQETVEVEEGRTVELENCQ